MGVKKRNLKRIFGFSNRDKVKVPGFKLKVAQIDLQIMLNPLIKRHGLIVIQRNE